MIFFEKAVMYGKVSKMLTGIFFYDPDDLILGIEAVVAYGNESVAPVGPGGQILWSGIGCRPAARVLSWHLLPRHPTPAMILPCFHR